MSAEAPRLRVAVVGAGPAGMYITEALTRPAVPLAQVDIFDRLPTPFGLLRYGVAPDHTQMKGLTTALHRILDRPEARFFGNVELGTSITADELLQDYHAVVYSVGSAVASRLPIPGDDLDGNITAGDFVSWYNAHPDAHPDAHADAPAANGAVQRAAAVQLGSSVSAVAVIGLGNVALDVCRVIAAPERLHVTDVPDEVLASLHTSSVRDIHIVGRGGVADNRFTLPELRELGRLTDVAVHVDRQDVPDVQAGEAKTTTLLREWSERSSADGRRRIHFHFRSIPVAALGPDRVTGLRIARSDTHTDLAVQLIVQAVGYRAAALPGVPFDPVTATIPTDNHRVVGTVGQYACGWVKRGPRGVLGTNRADAAQTVSVLREDHDVLLGRRVQPGTVMQHLRDRSVQVVTSAGWSAIDRAELGRGTDRGSTRVKLATWSDLLDSARNGVAVEARS